MTGNPMQRIKSVILALVLAGIVGSGGCSNQRQAKVAPLRACGDAVLAVTDGQRVIHETELEVCAWNANHPAYLMPHVTTGEPPACRCPSGFRLDSWK